MKPVREHTQFKRLLAQAELYETLLETVRASVPSALRRHVVGATLQLPCLIVQTDHAYYAGQIRFSEQKMLQAVLNQWPHLNLTHVKVKLVQIPHQEKPTMHQPKAPDAAIIEQLESLSMHVKQDKLKESLKKLVQTLGKRANN